MDTEQSGFKRSHEEEASSEGGDKRLREETEIEEIKKRIEINEKASNDAGVKKEKSERKMLVLKAQFEAAEREHESDSCSLIEFQIKIQDAQEELRMIMEKPVQIETERQDLQNCYNSILQLRENIITESQDLEKFEELKGTLAMVKQEFEAARVAKENLDWIANNNIIRINQFRRQLDEMQKTQYMIFENLRNIYGSPESTEDAQFGPSSSTTLNLERDYTPVPRSVELLDQLESGQQERNRKIAAESETIRKLDRELDDIRIRKEEATLTLQKFSTTESMISVKRQEIEKLK